MLKSDTYRADKRSIAYDKPMVAAAWVMALHPLFGLQEVYWKGLQAYGGPQHCAWRQCSGEWAEPEDGRENEPTGLKPIFDLLFVHLKKLVI